MEIDIVSFTGRGEALAKRVEEAFAGAHVCAVYTKWGRRRDAGNYVRAPLAEWTEKRFLEGHAIVFICACGIAVRAIAPSVRDKLCDPPVLVLDEAGTFVIPLLSGHYGGANALAEMLAGRLGAEAVLTTATDVNGLFAVDVFAADNGLWIADRGGIAQASAKLLERGRMTMAVDGEVRGGRPEVDVLVAARRYEKPRAGLHLIPRAVVLGMGCRRGKTCEELAAFVEEELAALDIPLQAVDVLATIDQKAGEPGLAALAERFGWRLAYAAAEELLAVKGEFSGSSFVEQTVGVDNVCERAACLAAGEGARLLLPKTAKDGMTLAVAERKWGVSFDGV